MANYVYVMTKMLHFYKFAISRRCRRAWKTSVGKVKIVLSEKIVLLLHPHVDVPCSLVVT